MEPTMSQFANVEDCLRARVEYFRKQRDELLAALKMARSEMPSVSSLPKTQTRIGDVIKTVEAAIAKAEASQE